MGVEPISLASYQRSAFKLEMQGLLTPDRIATHGLANILSPRIFALVASVM